MSLTKEIAVDRIEILEDGQMQIRQATRILEDGVVISQSFHRHVVAPGHDLSVEDSRVASVGGVLHTPDVVKKYKDKKDKEDQALANMKAAEGTVIL